MQPTQGRILCVDDHDSRNLVILLLEESGYEVVTASSMADGLSLAESAAFDLYLINHRLLSGSSTELCQQLRRADPHTPVLFYSSVTYGYSEKPVLSCGAEGELMKPIDISEVVPSVSKVINDQRLIAAA